MWPRIVELMLGLWLMASPFIFRHGDALSYWWNDMATGAIVVALSLLSYWRPARHAHLVTIAAGAWLIAFGYGSGTPRPPAMQNEITVGLLLAMIALIPSEASRPPEGWRNTSYR